MDSATFRVAEPAPTADADELARLIATVFRSEPTPEISAHVRRGLELPGWYRWNDSRVGWSGHQIVTHWGIIRYDLRVGHACLTTAGVGAVATLPQHRGMGLMQRTARSALDGLSAAGYDISVLFGIDTFYEQFGYVRAWPECTYGVDGDALIPTVPCPALSRFAAPFPEGYVEAHNRHNARATGTVVRTPCGGHTMAETAWEGILWRGTGGNIDGAVVFRKDEEALVVIDQFGDEEQVVAAVSQVCTTSATRRLRLPSLHEDSSLARRLRRTGCKVTRIYSRNGGALVRTVCLRSCLGKLRQDMQASLMRSDLRTWDGVLALSSGDEQAHVRLTAGKVDLAEPETTPHCLDAGNYAASLVLGAEPPDEILDRPCVHAAGDAAELAAALFPQRHPQMPVLDRY